MFPIEKYAPWIHITACLFLLFLPFCTVTVRNIEADSDEHWLFSPPFSSIEADTFVALTAQSLKSKDKKTMDQRCMHWKTEGVDGLACVFISLYALSMQH